MYLLLSCSTHKYYKMLKLTQVTNRAIPIILFKKQHLQKHGCTTLKQYSTVVTEKDLIETLKKKFPNAKNIIVEDISGGCGAMFDVFVESKDLKGLSVVKQHQTVTSALKEQIKSMHGIRIKTKVSES